MMNAKKSVFSYFIWIIYAILICVILSIYLAVGVLSKVPMLAGMPATIGAVCGSFLLLLLLFIASHKISASLTFRQAQEYGKMHLGSILAPILIVIGAVVRLAFYIINHVPIEMKNGTFYYQAVVTNSRNSLIFVVHGASNLYIRILHTLFLFLGNEPLAGIILQIVFYFASLLLLFFAIKMLSGTVPACAAMAALAFLPDTLVYTFTLTPEMIMLFLYCIGLWLSALLMRAYRKQKFKNVASLIPVLLLGAFIAFLIYLDLYAVTLLFVGIALLRTGTFRHALQNAGLVLMAEVLGVAVGAAIILVLLQLNGITITGYLSDWTALYFQKTGISAWSSSPDTSVVGSLILLATSFWVIPGFLVQKSARYGAYMCSLFTVIALPFFSINYMDYQLFVTLAWSIMAGAGIQCLTLTEKDPMPITERQNADAAGQNADTARQNTDAVKQNADTTRQKADAVKQKADITRQNTDIVKQAVTPEKAECMNTSENSEMKTTNKVPYVPLDNPLPVPKKHEKKEMDYKMELSGDMLDYDHEVSDEDDFDIQ